MSAQPAIEFDRVSKRYRVGRKSLSVRDDVAAGVRRMTGRPEEESLHRVLRALDDVSLVVPEGQAFAVIGDNGAGKTTALKVASRITYPSSGRVRVRGRVGALIEVGTGMHPELTGRENVDLYGRILGFSRRDIRKRFDEIVGFADVGNAIDRPVKQFSSGMQLRLGFSLAAHLEPDVLLVDEAISVGDAGFQYRCVERISDLVREGRTLVFVSHNMSAIEAICDRAVLLRHGRIVADGPAREVIKDYLHGVEDGLLQAGPTRTAPRYGEEVQLLGLELLDGDGREVDSIPPGGTLSVRLTVRASRAVRRPAFEVGISDGRIGPLMLASMLVDGNPIDELAGDMTVECTFPELPLMPRVYELWAGIKDESGLGELLAWQRLRLFRVEGRMEQAGIAAVSESLISAPVSVPYRWTLSPGDPSP
ncbi:MAG: lipopolysaccharide transport system ATP-binding protein [Gaiellaceae bacterium]|nr:lipopolysaccharide transport system ATP-binding protein [Gaiellaceae bacterium]MDX6543353.1 lipopolysaccharide transport system ATP-binding protein [Gaiellaceae bacterium]